MNYSQNSIVDRFAEENSELERQMLLQDSKEAEGNLGKNAYMP